MEHLEVRITPANVNWNGAVSNLMSVAGNYAGGVAPVAGDNIIYDPAILVVGAGFNNPKVDAALPNVSLQFASGYTGTLEVAANVGVQQISFYGSNGIQRITVDNGFTLTANIIWMDGTSGTKIDGQGSLAIVGAGGNAGYIRMANTATIGVSTMTIDPNSSMYIGSTTLTLDGTNVINDGAVNWLWGDIATAAASKVTNNGTFSITGVNHTYAKGATFTNDGLFSVTLFDPNASVNFNSPFIHNTPAGGPGAALVMVQCGNLRLNSSDTVSAEVSVNGGLYVTGAFTALVGATITGSGTVDVDGNGVLTAGAGLILTVSPLMMLTNNGGLTGPGWYQLNGGLSCTNGTIFDTTVDSAAVNLNDPARGTVLDMSNATIQFSGGTWSSGAITMFNGSRLQNMGVFNISSTDGITSLALDTSALLTSTGSTVAFTGAGVKWFSCYIVSAGSINLTGQSIQARKGFSQTGGSVVLGGGTIDLGPNPNQYYYLAGGTFNANGTITNGNPDVSGGTLELSGVLTLSGNLTLEAGGTFLVDTPQTEPWGAVNVTGSVTLGGTLAVNLMGGPAPPASSQTIITATTGVTGNFASVPAGWQVNKPNGKTVQLQKL